MSETSALGVRRTSALSVLATRYAIYELPDRCLHALELDVDRERPSAAAALEPVLRAAAERSEVGCHLVHALLLVLYALFEIGDLACVLSR